MIIILDDWTKTQGVATSFAWPEVLFMTGLFILITGTLIGVMYRIDRTDHQ